MRRRPWPRYHASARRCCRSPPPLVEIVTYQVVVTLPGGTSTTVTAHRSSCPPASPSSTVFRCPPTPASPPASAPSPMPATSHQPDGHSTARIVGFTLGTSTVPGSAIADSGQVTFSYTAVVARPPPSTTAAAIVAICAPGRGQGQPADHMLLTLRGRDLSVDERNDPAIHATRRHRRHGDLPDPPRRTTPHPGRGPGLRRCPRRTSFRGLFEPVRRHPRLQVGPWFLQHLPVVAGITLGRHAGRSSPPRVTVITFDATVDTSSTRAPPSRRPHRSVDQPPGPVSGPDQPVQRRLVRTHRQLAPFPLRQRQ